MALNFQGKSNLKVGRPINISSPLENAISKIRTKKIILSQLSMQFSHTQNIKRKFIPTGKLNENFYIRPSIENRVYMEKARGKGKTVSNWHLSVMV